MKSFLILACSVSFQTVYASFIPKNNLSIPPTAAEQSGISEQEFENIVDDVASTFIQAAPNTLGKPLKVQKLWSDGTVNAYASRDSESAYVTFFGGFARHPAMTADAMANVVCHEIGHHFGGFPFYSALSWAATEGQADYFASSICLKNYWMKKNFDAQYYANKIPQDAQLKCDSTYSSEKARAVCYRIISTNLDLAKFYAAIYHIKEPQLNTPSTKVVLTTFQSHPQPQCRLDTGYQAALCPVAQIQPIVPGRNIFEGQFGTEAEMDAARNSCLKSSGFSQGYRPSCWFKELTKDSRFVIRKSGLENIAPGESKQILFKIENLTPKNFDSVFSYPRAISPSVYIDEVSTKTENLTSRQSKNMSTPLTFRVAQGAECQLEPIKFRVLAGSESAQATTEIGIGIETVQIPKLNVESEISPSQPTEQKFTYLVQDDGNFIGAKIHLDIDHDNYNDLELKLVSPLQNEYRLFKGETSWNNGFFINFNKYEPKGNWTLVVKDTRRGKGGMLHSWQMQLLNSRCQ